MFSENVQKNKSNHEGARMKVNYVGVTREGIKDTPRYKNLISILNHFEDMLDEPLSFDVHLDFITLHALFIAATPLNEYEKDPTCNIIDHESTIEKFEVMDPVNFFKLINDISAQKKIYKGEDIYDKYLRDEKTLKRLDRFYNEYEDIYDICVRQNYTSLYLFEAICDNDRSHPSLDNILKHIHDDNKVNRHFVCVLLNEFYNEIYQHNISERTQSEYWYNIYRINEKLEDILADNKIDKTKPVTIDWLFHSIKAA